MKVSCPEMIQVDSQDGNYVILVELSFVSKDEDYQNGKGVQFISSS
jgi:hypothetical protein